MAGPPLAYRDFRAGLDTKDAPYILDEGLGALPCRDVQNVQATTAGAIVKRNGLATFASPAAAFTSLFGVEATASLFLIGATSSDLFKVTTGGVVSSIKGANTVTNGRWEGVTAPANGGQGPVWLMNGVDPPLAWDGAAGAAVPWTATSGAVPNGKYVITHQNQVFVAGMSANPSRVQWSGLQAGLGALPRDWDAAANNGAGAMDFDPGDGQVITGLGVVGPYVLVAKPRKLWVVVDPVSATVRRVSENVGVISHRSIANGSAGTYFLAEDRGVYFTNGSSVTPISDKIQPTIDAVGGQKPNVAGGFFNGHYYLSVAGAGSGANDTTLDYDETLQSWWKHTFGSNQFAVWHPAGTAQLYSAKSTAAIVDQCFVVGTNVDNGVAFKWRWAGPWQSPSFYRRRLFPTPQYRKRFRQVRFDGAGNVDFSLATDFALTESLMRAGVFGSFSAPTTWGGTGTWGVTGAWGDAPSVSRTKLFPSKVANAFSLVFSSTSQTADSILSYTMYLIDRSDSQS